MTCAELTAALHGYVDKELDPVRSLAIEQHLKACPACQRRLEAAQAVRQVVAGQAAYFEAPRPLYRRVHSAVRAAGRTEVPPARRRWELSWLWPRVLAPAAVVALALLVAWPWLTQPSAQSGLPQAIVSAHIRSLMAGHLTDVASSDQHTVKPWFNGKVPFSPPVVDPAAQGFTLVGGRLDVVEEQPVAALVYQRRQHFINLFVWPSTRSGSPSERFLALHGYNLIHWTKDGMDCWAASDVSRADLQEFARLAGAGAE